MSPNAGIVPHRRSSASPPNPRLQSSRCSRPDEAARLLSVKPSSIYEAVRARRLPCVRLGRHIRFTQRMLEEWLADEHAPVIAKSRSLSRMDAPAQGCAALAANRGAAYRSVGHG